MEPNIPDILRSTAKNLSDLFEMLARRVEALEKENAELKQRVINNDNAK